MSTLSLASIKKNFGITDDLPIKYERKDNELILHIPIQSAYHENEKIINQARKLADQRKKDGWSREDFFNDFVSGRDKVLKDEHRRT